MTVNVSQRLTEPVAYITKGKQRVKQYDRSVYLENGDEFELELFNPTTQKILAKISLNGNSLGSGIILRPGERVFLERYLNEARKFLFETYEVSSDDPNVQKAIAKNGDVEIEFYTEWVHSNYAFSSWTYNPPPQPPYIVTNTPGFYYYETTKGFVKDGGCVGSTSNSNKLSQSDNMYNCSCSLDNQKFEETGRIEKGSISDQSFTYDNTCFNSWYNWKTTWKILPKSKKPIYREDIKVFCTNCGARRKKSSHKFCPNCGNRFN